MRKASFISITVCVLAAAALGCGGGRGRRPPTGDVDSGGVRVDSGTSSGTDGGGMPDTDSGIVDPGFDAGPGPGFDAGGPPPRDAGGTRTCKGGMVEPVVGMFCSAATMTCTEGCTTGACIAACLEADASPDCNGCANNNIIACINANGCQGTWDVFNCCAEDNCATASDPPSCIMTMCASSRMAYLTCQMGVPTSAMCGAAWADCF